MKNLKRLRKLWNDVLDELEAKALAWNLRAALKRHGPVMFDVDARTVHPHDSAVLLPWCMACVEHWPCDRWREVAGLAAKLDIDGS